MNTHRRTSPAETVIAPRRAGAITLEFLLCFPILFIVTLALFEFGILMLVQQAATAAAIQGAIEGAKVGHGDDDNDGQYMDNLADDVAVVVQQHLALHRLTFNTTVNASPTTEQVRLRVERNPGDGFSTSVDRGNTNLPLTAYGPAPGSGELRVSLTVQLTDTNGLRPVPNWLSVFGFNLTGRELQISSRAGLENNSFNP